MKTDDFAKPICGGRTHPRIERWGHALVRGQQTAEELRREGENFGPREPTESAVLVVKWLDQEEPSTVTRVSMDAPDELRGNVAEE